MEIVVFRANFPEFGDTIRYSDGMITFWADMGAKLISAERFGNLYDEALSLFTAHNITLAAANNAGGSPGQGSALVSSKAVGSVSVSYDTTATLEKDAGHYNQTSYGKQYMQLARMIGHGAVQL